MAEPTQPSGAVFLSYASQDAAAARRICEALRTAGVEVWFDQNELTGGDVWDAKIRKQIADCALFVPVISAATQARHEGYFRLEWKLAAQRTHMMSGAKAFLLPVVIDATGDADAHVPEEFRAVQWTRLPGGKAAEKFCGRVKVLLEGEGGDASPRRPSPHPQESRGRLGETSLTAGPKRRWLVPAILSPVALVALALWQPWRGKDSPAVPSTPVLAAKAAATPTVSASAGRDEKSVAVLPFLNRSGDPEQEYFSAALTEEILGALRRERDLTVPGNISCFSFKGRNVPAAEIAQALNVARLVEGSVQRVGSRVRIRVTLSRPADNSSEELGTFTEELTDIFALQDKVARAVVAKLARRSTTAPVAVLTKVPEAYDAYLRGRALQTIDGDQNLASGAAKFYERAVELDPLFALAWARLAEARLRTYSGGRDQSSALAESVRLAVDQALAAQPNLPEALIVRGNWVRLVQQDFASAQRDLDHAAMLQGPSAELRSAQRLLVLDRGDHLGSMRLARDCIALDPENPDLIYNVGLQFFRAGEFAEAERVYARLRGMTGRTQNREAWRGPDAALRLLERATSDASAVRAGKLRILTALGRKEEAGLLVELALEERGVLFEPILLAHHLGHRETARRLAEGMRSETKLELQRGNRASGIWRNLVAAEIVLGNHAGAFEALADWRNSQMTISSEYRRVNGFHGFVIGFYSLLGKPDEDLALMKEYIAAGWHRGYAWRHDWKLEPLRNNPEFLELARQEEALAKAQPDPIDP